MRAATEEGTETLAPALLHPGTPPAPGTGVLLRAAVPGDADHLDRMFSRCSAETIWLRFHLPFARVPQTMLVRLTELPPELGRTVVAAVGNEVVGHAMYAREKEGDLEAEVAVVVEDGWSSRGIGHLLLAEIREKAERGGVETLICTTLADNRRLLNLTRRAFPGTRIYFSCGAYHLRLPLGSSVADENRDRTRKGGKA